MKLKKLLKVCGTMTTIRIMPIHGNKYITGSIIDYMLDTPFSDIVVELEKYNVKSIYTYGWEIVCCIDISDDYTFIDKLISLCEKKFISLNVCDRVAYCNAYNEKPYRCIKIYDWCDNDGSGRCLAIPSSVCKLKDTSDQ